MREWGFIAPSRVGRTQRPKIQISRWRFLRPPSPSLAANKAGLHRKRMSLSGTDAGWLSESQQPASALAFIAFGVTVLVTTIDLECTSPCQCSNR
jgi:hypothetical protein